MNETQKKTLTAAIEVFSRYGVRRATMGDIADQAEVSRQTLYAAFKNKDEIFAAATHAMGVQILAQVREACGKTDRIEDKLDAYIEYAILQPFDLMQKMPDSRDLINGVSKAAERVIKEIEQQKAELLVEEFSKSEETLRAAGTDSKTLAEFFENASRNFKYSATDRKQLEKLLETLKRSVLAMMRI